MNRLRSLSALLVVLAHSACGLPDDAPGMPLWEATFKGKQVSFFGTIHSLSLDDARAAFPSALQRFDGRGTLYVESDMESAEGLSSIRLFGRKLSDEPNLDTQLTAEEWTTLTTALKPFVPEADLKRMKPWLASMLYLEVVAPSVDAQGQRITSMDNGLVNEAKAAGIEVRFLETTTSAVLALDRATTPDDLKATLGAGPDGIKQARAALEADWKAGRLDSIATTLRKLPEHHRKELLDTRNVSWGVGLPTSLETAQEPVFVAAGLGHFIIGDDDSFPSVLRLFRVPLLRVSP